MIKRRFFSVLFLFFTLSYSAPAFATIGGSATSLVITNQGILPSSPPTAVIGLNLTGIAGDLLTSVTVAVNNVDGFAAGDLIGVYIYADSGGVGDGVFDSSDTLLGGTGGGGGTINIASSPQVPLNDSSPYVGNDYFVVIQTDSDITHADAFTVTVYTISGNNITGIYGVTTGTIKCECKVADVFYTESFHYDWLSLESDLYDLYNRANYLSYSIRTEMTEPDETDPDGTAHAWYLTELGNYRYSYMPDTQNPAYTQAKSNELKFSRKRQLLQMWVPTAILGIKVAGNDQGQAVDSGQYDDDYLSQVIIQFTDTDGSNFNAERDLFPINTIDEAQSGVALWVDTNHNGILDEGDTPVDLWNAGGVATWDTTGNQLTIDVAWFGYYPATAIIPQTYDAESGHDPVPDTSYPITFSHDRTGTDFLVVIRARPQTALDSYIQYGADFTAQITDMTFTGGTALSDYANWYSTKELKAVLELSDYTGCRSDPDSLFPIIGINAVDGPDLYEKLYSITLQIQESTGFDPNTDLSGTLFYQDDGDENGVFDSEDTIPSGVSRTAWAKVSMADGNWWETTISISPGLDLADTDTGTNQGDDYYIVLQTTDGFGYLDSLTCRILDGGIVFRNQPASAVGTTLITNALLDPVSNTRVNWNPNANPTTPLRGNVAVKYHTLNPSLTAGGEPIAVLGLELSSNTTAATQPVLKTLVVQLMDIEGGEIDLNDLAAMSTNSQYSGLGIWKDNGDGVFSTSSDVSLTMVTPPSQAVGVAAENYQRFILILNSEQTINQDPSGHSDYFVTVCTKDMAAGDEFIMRMWGSEMKPPASYAVGVRNSNATVTSTETTTYDVTATSATTLSITPVLGGSQADYNQNWYVIITQGATTAIGKIEKVTGVDAGLSIITCDEANFTGLGTISQVRVFRLDGTNYQNHSVSVTFTGDYAVTLSAESGVASITLTWTDGTPSGTKEFVIERKDVTSKGSFTVIEDDSESADPEPTQTGTNTYEYVDNDTTLVQGYTYAYKVTVKVTGVGSYTSNTVEVTLSEFALSQKPENLEASAGVMVVDLTWEWSDGYRTLEDGFSIERKGKSEADFTVIGTVGGNDLNFGKYTDEDFTDSMLAVEQTYQYRVRAYMDVEGITGYSEYSDIVEIEVIPSFSTSLEGGGTGSLSCFIATAAFGTPLAKEVGTLRDFRDRFLLKKEWGRTFINFYYRYSPPIADFIRTRPALCSLVRGFLRPVIWLTHALGK